MADELKSASAASATLEGPTPEAIKKTAAPKTAEKAAPIPVTLGVARRAPENPRKVVRRQYEIAYEYQLPPDYAKQVLSDPDDPMWDKKHSNGREVMRAAGSTGTLLIELVGYDDKDVAVERKTHACLAMEPRQAREAIRNIEMGPDGPRGYNP